jgi:hypothetical protein
LVLILTAGLVVLALYTIQQEGQPDANLINLAVRATIYAMPSPSPQIVEVTRVVEVTRMVEIVRVVEVTPTLAAPTATPTMTPSPVAVAPAEPRVALAAVASEELAKAASEEVPPEAVAQVESIPSAPFTESGDGACPTVSNNQYTAIPVTGAPASHPDSLHGDLNLALRGYVPAEAALSLVDINGPSDGDSPQLDAVLGRLASFGRAYRARDWNWACGDLGCRGEELGNVEVSLLALQSSPGEPVFVPSRGAEIYGGGFVALVLYADPSRLTVVYTREDSVANGYAVHLEEFCVDPNLLGLYQSNNAAGRGSLPAVRNGEAVGTAHYHQVVVGVRDRGAFTDPRSRKDWWHGY